MSALPSGIKNNTEMWGREYGVEQGRETDDFDGLKLD